MKINYIHFYVEDARASCNWFVNHMGFQTLVSGKSHHTLTTVVNSGAVNIVLSSPLAATSPVAKFLNLHPASVADIAFEVSNLECAMAKAIANQAKVLQPIDQHSGTQGSGRWAKIAAWGALTHTLIESSCGSTPLLPIIADLELTQEPFSLDKSSQASLAHLGLFTGIDHVVLNVAAGDLELALSWYENVLGFQRQQKFMIQTDQSGLSSQVLVHPVSGLQFPINEPTSASSQIQEFLDVNQGSGIQHIALQTPEIVNAIAQLRDFGMSFLQIPSTYYTELQLKYPQLPLSPLQLDEIAEQEILVDWQDESKQALLLQTFTQPIFSEPTFFFELIERRQEAQGFGEGNFRALFEAIEREQVKRGSLRLG